LEGAPDNVGDSDGDTLGALVAVGSVNGVALRVARMVHETINGGEGVHNMGVSGILPDGLTSLLAQGGPRFILTSSSQYCSMGGVGARVRLIKSVH
jgi:hypothetical protein